MSFICSHCFFRLLPNESFSSGKKKTNFQPEWVNNNKSTKMNPSENHLTVVLRTEDSPLVGFRWSDGVYQKKICLIVSPLAGSSASRGRVIGCVLTAAKEMAFQTDCIFLLKHSGNVALAAEGSNYGRIQNFAGGLTNWGNQGQRFVRPTLDWKVKFDRKRKQNNISSLFRLRCIIVCF